MRPAARVFIGFGAVLLALGVALGALGSHGAKAAAHPDAARLLQTAVLYQLVHGLGIVAVGILAQRAERARLLLAAGALLCAGVVLFCGSLQLLAWSGAAAGLAPAGGSALIAGWACLAAWAGLARPG